MLNIFFLGLKHDVCESKNEDVWISHLKNLKSTFDQSDFEIVEKILKSPTIRNIDICKHEIFLHFINEIYSDKKLTVLENVGMHTFKYFFKNIHSYLSILGNNILEFTENLQDLIIYFESIDSRTLHSSNLPIISVQQNSETNFDVLFKSKNSLFQNISVGFIKEASVSLFKTNLKITVAKEWKDATNDFVLNCTLLDSSIPMSTLDINLNNAEHLDPFFLSQISPCYLVIDENENITEMGIFLLEKLKIDMESPKKFEDVFEIISSFDDISTVENLFKYSKDNIILKPIPHLLKPEYCDTQAGDTAHNNIPSIFYVKGQLIHLSETNCYWLIGFPHFENVNAIKNTDTFLNDITVHNGARDVVVLKQFIEAENTHSKNMLDIMSQLKNIQDDLEEESKQTEDIISELFPEYFANKLIQGIPTDAVNYSEVVVLCSDIVGFTNMSSQMTPMEIIMFLKTLFSKFDDLCHEFQLRKIETTGDGYMVATGIQVTQDKFKRLINMAFKMIEAANQSFDTSGNPIKIRIGIHSGPVIAAVVGLSSPRFCLFGQTIAIASKLEQSGVPNNVHVSESIFKNLPDNEYVFTKREIPNEQNVNNAYTDSTYIVQLKNQ